jgi:hypothetical protein
LSFFNIIITSAAEEMAAISYMIWWFSNRAAQRSKAQDELAEKQRKIAEDEEKERQAEQQQQAQKLQVQQAKELRLQEHVKLLSSTDGMHIIEFEQQCSDMFADRPEDENTPSYGTVFRHRQQMSENGICVTRARLRGVNAARKELQGIWDNICGDFKGNRLPGAITEKSNSRIFKRAQTYIAAAEPLEAANRGRMEDRKHVPASPPYLGQPGTTNAGRQYPTFHHGVRPWRFFWLEDQLAMQLTAGKSKL